MMPAFTKNCIVIYETTANGFNDFKDMWDSGTYINCFYEWWRTGEYRHKFESAEKKKSLATLSKAEGAGLRSVFGGWERKDSKKSSFTGTTTPTKAWLTRR